MTLPAARTVRDGSRRVVRSPWPRRVLHRPLALLRAHRRAVAAHALGLYPIWAVAALALGLLWSAGLAGSP